MSTLRPHLALPSAQPRILVPDTGSFLDGTALRRAAAVLCCPTTAVAPHDPRRRARTLRCPW